MKKKKILDIIMFIIMILLMNLSFTKVKIHEVLGIVIFCLFIYHKILNIKWIKAVTKNLFNNKTKVKTKIIYVVDLLLLILVVLNVATGILISTYILTNITTNNIGRVSMWHHFFAYLLATLLLIHLGLHWEFIRNMFKIKKNSLLEKIVIGIIIVLITFIGIKNDIFKKLIPPIKYEEKEKEEEKEQKEEDKKEEEKEDKEDKKEEEPITKSPTLEEYLSKLYCSGCGRHCPLIKPSCRTGINKQKQEIEKYNKIYVKENKNN